MAIPEACGLWIEQRVQEELDAQGEEGVSLREIGRVVAAEVEKHFETKIAPTTIAMRVHRMKNSVTNVTPNENDDNSATKPNLEKLEKPKHGGERKGAGRKSKQQQLDHQAKTKIPIESHKKKPKSIDPQTVVKNVIFLRRQFSEELRHLKSLRDSKRLSSDQPFKEIENELRLLIHEAVELGMLLPSEIEQ